MLINELTEMSLMISFLVVADIISTPPITLWFSPKDPCIQSYSKPKAFCVLSQSILFIEAARSFRKLMSQEWVPTNERCGS